MRRRSDAADSAPCLPINDDCWPSEISDMRNGFAGTMNSYRTMALHPALLRAWAPLRRHVVKDNALGPTRSELVVLRAAYRLRSDYEWKHHVSRARAIGFSDERIRAMCGTPDGEDGLIARAVDALFDERRLPSALEAELSAAIGRRAVFDLIATVGFYSTLGYLVMTYDTPFDEAIAIELAARPLSPPVEDACTSDEGLRKYCCSDGEDVAGYLRD